jgi:hypothetical protein
LSSLICTIGADEQLPMHSTSVSVKRPSAVVWPFFMPFLQARECRRSRAACTAWCRRPARGTADRRDVVHRVEGGHFEHADDRHVELGGDIFHHRQRQPALRVLFGANLALGQIEQRHDRRTLASGGIARDDLAGLGRIGLGPGESAPARAQFGAIGFG